MAKKILVTPKSFVASKEIGEAIFKNYDVEVVWNTTGKTLNEEQMLELSADVDGVLVGVDPMPAAVLRNAKNLKAISKYGSGLDNIDLDVAKELHIEVTRALGGNSEGVAELAIALMFAISRNLYPAIQNVKAGGWDRLIGTEVNHKTAGIVGLGAIGREVARVCHGLGMNILGYDPYLNNPEFIQKYDVKLTNLDEIYENCDVLFLHSPLTDETREMINKDVLKRMKNTAYIINPARGELVNEDDLYDALVNGEIAGAAQDVFSKEPAGEHKLLTLNNFYLTPHLGAFTKESTHRTIEISAQNLMNMLFK